MDAEHCENRLDKDEGKSKDKEPGMACSICLDGIQREDAAKSEPCEHIFHESCLRTSLSYNTRCPMCRDEISLICRVSSGTLMKVPQYRIGIRNSAGNIRRQLQEISAQMRRMSQVIGRHYEVANQMIDEMRLELRS